MFVMISHISINVFFELLQQMCFYPFTWRIIKCPQINSYLNISIGYLVAHEVQKYSI